MESAFKEKSIRPCGLKAQMGCGNSLAVPSLPDSGYQSRMSQHSRAGGDCLIARVRFSGRHEIRSRLGDQKCTAPCAESTYMKSTNPKFRIHDLASTQIFSPFSFPFHKQVPSSTGFAQRRRDFSLMPGSKCEKVPSLQA